LLHPRTTTMYKHRRAARKQAAAEQTARARRNGLGRAQFGKCQRCRICESSGSCAHIIRPTEQRCCTHASPSHTNTVGPHENEPRQSKQLARAAIVPVVLDSALGIRHHSGESSGSCACTSYAPPSSVAAPTHHDRAHTPKGRTKTSRGRANSSRARQ